VTTANIELAPFRYSRASDTWWWADETYRLFGFAPAEVVPTTDLILRHQHPEDVDPAWRLARVQLAERRPLCVWHRIVDARRRVRQLLTHGEGVFDDLTGEWSEVRGVYFDVTHALRTTYSRDVDEAVRAAAGTRAVIEQAKGALMLSQRISAEHAFQLLRRCSQATNVKVRDLAGSVMSAAVTGGELPATLTHLADGLDPGQGYLPAPLADGGSADGGLDQDADPVH